MRCPQCGYDMGNKNKCIRCGYEVHDVAVVKNDRDDNEEPKKEKQDEPDVKVIDPCNVYLTHPYGYDDDFGTGFGPGGDPFASLFGDLFGDPIGDLLGGLFGFDVSPRRPRPEEPPKKKKKTGPVVEVTDVEFLDANNHPIDGDNPTTGRRKNKFRRNGSDGK